MTIDLDYLLTEVMKGKGLDKAEIPNTYKEKVLKTLEEKVNELELDKEKNFVELENIKLFLQNYFN